MALSRLLLGWLLVTAWLLAWDLVAGRGAAGLRATSALVSGEGVLLTLIAGLWFGDWRLSLVLAAAMLFNMMWSGIAGTMIPLTLARLGVDPAIAAGPCLTTTTDVLGFFLFLGLATVFLL